MQSYGVTLSDLQKKSLARAVDNSAPVNIKLSNSALTGPDQLMLNSNHMARIERAREKGTGAVLKFTAHHLNEALKRGGLPFLKPLIKKVLSKLTEDVPNLFRDTSGGNITKVLDQFPGKVLNLMSPTSLFGKPGLGDLFNKMKKALRGSGQFTGGELDQIEELFGNGGLFLPGTVRGNGLFLPGSTGGASIGDILVYSGDGLWLPGTIGVHRGDGILDDIGEFIGRTGKKVKPILSNAARDLGDQLLDEAEDIANDEILPWMQEKMSKARSKTKKK